MKIRYKILLTIALAALCVWLFGCSPPVFSLASGYSDDTNLAFLNRLYASDNETYFENKLPPVVIRMGDAGRNMAQTMCAHVAPDGTGIDCVMTFNMHYEAAPRIARYTMLHESCHVKTWGKDVDGFGQYIEHGRAWRTCMLNLDAQGVFREIFIDGYAETQ